MTVASVSPPTRDRIYGLGWQHFTFHRSAQPFLPRPISFLPFLDGLFALHLFLYHNRRRAIFPQRPRDFAQIRRPLRLPQQAHAPGARLPSLSCGFRVQALILHLCSRPGFLVASVHNNNNKALIARLPHQAGGLRSRVRPASLCLSITSSPGYTRRRQLLNGSDIRSALRWLLLLHTCLATSFVMVRGPPRPSWVSIAFPGPRHSGN